MDSETTVNELKKEVQTFCEERDWSQFHGPKDLAIGISTEANELLAEFRFKSEREAQALLTCEKRERVEDELADTLFFILRFAQMNDVDLSDALQRKIEKDEVNYPIDLVRGKNAKYDEYKNSNLV